MKKQETDQERRERAERIYRDILAWDKEWRAQESARRRDRAK